MTTEASVGVTVRKGTNGRLQAVGVIDVGHLIDNYEIPHRNSKTKTGYQRLLSRARVRRLAADLRRGRVDLPTAVLINIRDFNPSDLVDLGNGLHRLELGDYTLWVVDGQHRIGGLDVVAEENPEKWRTYQIPFVCTLGAPEEEEMNQFYVVNSNAKSVPTDLAYDLLTNLAQDNKDAYEALVERRENWKVDGQKITEALRDTRRWKGRIRMSDDPIGDTTIKSAAVVNSLRPMLGVDYFSVLSIENQVGILSAFWGGIADVFPEAFEDPSRYALQKSNGVIVLHSFLPSVLEVIRSKGLPVLDAESYAGVLVDPLERLEGTNAEGDPVSGVDFWTVGPEGAAGAFTSNSGRRVLVNKLKRELPEPDVE